MDTQSRSGFKVYCLIWFDFYFSREKLGRQSLVACAFLAKSITTWRGALGGNTWDWRNSFKSWRIFVHFDSFYGLLFQYGAAVWTLFYVYRNILLFVLFYLFTYLLGSLDQPLWRDWRMQQHKQSILIWSAIPSAWLNISITLFTNNSWKNSATLICLHFNWYRSSQVHIVAVGSSRHAVCISNHKAGRTAKAFALWNECIGHSIVTV